MLKKWPVGATSATIDLSATLILASFSGDNSRRGCVVVYGYVQALVLYWAAAEVYVARGDALQ